MKTTLLTTVILLCTSWVLADQNQFVKLQPGDVIHEQIGDQPSILSVDKIDVIRHDPAGPGNQIFRAEIQIRVSSPCLATGVFVRTDSLKPYVLDNKNHRWETWSKLQLSSSSEIYQDANNLICAGGRPTPIIVPLQWSGNSSSVFSTRVSNISIPFNGSNGKGNQFANFSILFDGKDWSVSAIQVAKAPNLNSYFSPADTKPENPAQSGATVVTSQPTSSPQ